MGAACLQVGSGGKLGTNLSGCLVEPSLLDAPISEAVQFERTGYFALDPDSQPNRPVFNRTVGLRDTWAKVQASTKG